MTVIADFHRDHGATFEERDGRSVVSHYGRPERTHTAVRRGVGTIEMGYGVVAVSGDDRIDFVDDTVSNRVPRADGAGRYALLLDPQGRIETDMHVYNAGERLLLFTPSARAAPLVEEWREKVFIQDVTIRDATDEFAVFGVHGPQSTEKVASVLAGAGAPESTLTFVRGSMGDAGVTVIAADAPVGEEGYEVVCAADVAEDVFDTLVTRGNPAVPFGYRTWETLTTEAGTPLFETELAGRVPNVLGLRHALDFEKGCYVGQEVVSKVENRGRPSRRLVGLRLESLPETGATVRADGEAERASGSRTQSDDASASETSRATGGAGDPVGEVTRAVESPTLGAPIALALVDFDRADDVSAVTVDDEAERASERVPAEPVPLPFVEGSDRSARLPRY